MHFMVHHVCLECLNCYLTLVFNLVPSLVTYLTFCPVLLNRGREILIMLTGAPWVGLRIPKSTDTLHIHPKMMPLTQ